MYRFLYASPVGPLRLISDEESLTGLYFGSEPDFVSGSKQPFSAVCEQLDDYFEGKLPSFDLPIKLQGTPFQLKVWEALRQIPYGQTQSYGDLAVKIGQPDAVRAVGAANGKNPISIIVPCHRVIGKTGKLTGYGGGLEIKAFLLALEGGQKNLFCMS